MSRSLSDYEAALVELVAFLARGTHSELGLSSKEIKNFLLHPVKGDAACLVIDRLRDTEMEFVNELKTYVNDNED